MYEKLSIEAKLLIEALKRKDPRYVAANWTVYLQRLAEHKAVESALLFAAAQYGEDEILTNLCTHKVNINVVDAEGRTPLFSAVANSEYACMRIILERPECDPFKKDNNGQTVFHVAAWMKDNHLLKYLWVQVYNREKDADSILTKVDCPDTSGKTPLFLAAQYEQEDSVMFLAEQGFDVNCNVQGHAAVLIQMITNGRVNGLTNLLANGAISHKSMEKFNNNIFKYLITRNLDDHTLSNISQNLLNYGAGIGIAIPDKILELDIDWKDVCIIGASYNQTIASSGRLINFDLACKTLANFAEMPPIDCSMYRHGHDVVESALSRPSIFASLKAKIKYCNDMVQLNSDNNGIQTLYIGMLIKCVMQRAWFTHCRYMLLLDSDSKELQGLYHAMLAKHHTLQEIFRIKLEDSPKYTNLIAGLQTTRKGLEANNDMPPLESVLRFEKILGISLGSLQSKIDTDSRRKIITILHQELADLKVQANAFKELLNQLKNQRMILEGVASVSVGVLCTVGLYILYNLCLALFIYMMWPKIWQQEDTVLHIILIDFAPLLMPIYIIAVCSVAFIIVVGISAMLISYLEEVGSTRTISSYSANAQESYRILLELLNGGELLSIEPLLFMLQQLTENSRLSTIIYALDGIIEFDPEHIPTLKEDVSIYPTKFDKARIQFFPPPPPPPPLRCEVVIKIDTKEDGNDIEMMPLLDNDEIDEHNRRINSAAMGTL